MLRDEVAKYTELSGNDGEHTPIGIIGAYLDGYDKGLELSVSENPNKWIPVSERLPEKDGQYLVTYDREDEIKVDVSYFDKYGFWIGNVDAWMPLPEAYKAERGE